MIRKRELARLLCMASSAVVLSSCQLLSGDDSIEKAILPSEPSGPKITFDAFRAKDPQSKIGAKGHPKILAANGGAYQDEKLETLLALITGRLVAHTDDPDRAFDITILDSPTVNAFALPGGYLYVTRGLLALANDASEVAAVLAHEMAHVSSNHGVERSRQADAVDLAEKVANQVVSNPVVGELAKASTERRLASFSQRQELQADAVGIKLLGRAGFDAFAASRFLKSMDRYSKWRSASNTGGRDMSSSHPSTPRRIELAERHARAIGPKGSGERNRERFLKGVDGMLFGDQAKQGFVRGNRFAHTKLGITFSVPAGFELTNRSSAVHAAGPNQMALRFDAVSTKNTPQDPVAYLKSGWVNGLIENTTEALTINGMSAARARAQAGDWQFVITVVDKGSRHYRFILAAPRTAQNIEAAGYSIPNSFRELTKSDKALLKPLRLKVIRVRTSDTLASLSSRMQGVSRKVDLFRALNALSQGQRPKAGTSVKIITTER